MDYITPIQLNPKESLTFEAWNDLVIQHVVRLRQREKYGEPLPHLLHLYLNNSLVSAEVPTGVALLPDLESGDEFRHIIADVRKIMAKQGLPVKYMTTVVELGFVRRSALEKYGEDTPYSDIPEQHKDRAIIIASQHEAETAITVFLVQNHRGKQRLLPIPESAYPGNMRDDVLPLFDPNDVPPEPDSLFPRTISDVL